MANGIILYADDDEVVRELYSGVFERGFSDLVREGFPNGSSLVARLEEGIDLPAVVVIDNSMKESLRGVDIIRTYANDPRFRGKVPFILVSGEEELEKDAMKIGAYAFVKKPFGFDLLISTVQSAFDYSRASSQ